MSKSNRIEKVVANSIIYSVCGLLLKCFNFFLLPLYTAHLTTEDYGITSISSTFISTMVFIVAFSLFSAVMRFYVDLKEDEEKLKRFYGTIITFVFISGIIFGIVMILLKDVLCRYVFVGIDFFPVVFVSIISLIFCCQHTIYENILRSQQKALKYATVALTYFFVNVIFNIILIVVLKKGAIGVILTNMIGNALYTVFFIWDMVRNKTVKFCLDIPLLKEALQYSIPIMPHNLSTLIAQLVSKVMIGRTGTLGTLGVYSVAMQFATIADTIQAYVNQAYGPWLYEMIHDKCDGYKQNIASLSEILCVVIGLAFLGISLFSHDYIVLFINKSFVSAWQYIPAIVMVFIIKIVYYFYVNILFYYKEASRFLFVATLSSSLINILLSYFMIPILGGFGSIISDAIAMLIQVFIVVIISKRYEDIGLSLGMFAKKIFVIALFIIGGSALSYIKFWNKFSIANLIYKIMFIMVYVAIYAFRFRTEIMTYKNNILCGKGKRKWI